MDKRLSTRETILGLIEEKGSATGPELAAWLGITRQAVNPHLRELMATGKIFKTGSTRAARYFPASAAPAGLQFKRTFPIENLDESDVFEQLSMRLSPFNLPSNIEAVLHYAFTEMLNNAIDQSMSDRCAVEVSIDATKVSFTVRDQGIGVFSSIAGKFNLPDEHAALFELVKGKTTTMPQAHSGEGIFFVSRSADRFILRSHRQQLEWDRAKKDVFVSDHRFIRGTLVDFEIGRNSRTRLEDVFAEFAPEKYDYRFEKTRVMVKLMQKDYVSRSEAKRLLHNLHKFSEIEVDMGSVRHVGQGFADEIFRVFAAAHPDIEIRAINASGAVDAMLRHVRDKS